MLWGQGGAAADAGDIPFTPVGGLAATDVQAALAELDTEKAAASHTQAESTLTFTDITTGNASTTAHGFAPKATAPAAGLVSVLGIANGETVRADKALFDATNPAALGTAAPGTALTAARRDHVHAVPALGDLSNVGTATPTDKHVLVGDGDSFESRQLASTDLSDVSVVTGADDDLLQRKSGAWTNRTVAQVKTDLALSNVTNDAQTKAAVVPNTAPAAGQLLVGNAGGTAYAPVAASGDVTVAATGAVTVGNDAITYAKLQNVSAADKLLGRATAGAGDVEEIACTAAGRALLDDASAGDQRTTLGAAAAGAATASGLTMATGRVLGRTTASTGAIEELSSVDGFVSAASDAAAGKVELAIASEVTAGSDATRAVTPDALAGSTVFGRKVVQIAVVDAATDCAIGDGKAYFVVPESLNGMNLVRVHGRAITAGTTGTMDVQIRNVTQTADMLSTKLTWDSTEAGTDTAATAAVIDTANDDVATNDLLAVDVDAVQTTKAKGMIITLEFALP